MNDGGAVAGAVLLRLVVVLGMLLAGGPALGQDVPFTSSNLPIVVIETDGVWIPDEPKIMARMGVIDNGLGARNRLGDPFNAYDGWIGIETRGSSSQRFPKQQYAVETRAADGSNRNVSLLGFPEENDWILHAPYSDKSLMRNVLAYHLANRTGRYASRTRYCEVVLDGDYRGVYVLMEKVKWDDARVPVARLRPGETSGDDLTGGYIIKIDKTDGAEVDGWVSSIPPPARPDARIFYQYHYPRPSEIVPAQAAYIRGFVTGFEERMQRDDFADPDTGYPQLLDVGSFVDYLLVNELGRNVDGYRLSAFMHKQKDSDGGKLVMGPLWDFNLAFGNADYYGGSATDGFQVDFAVERDGFHLPFWWGRLLEDPVFAERVEARWHALRAGPFHEDTLNAYIDGNVALLSEAQQRNFRRWPILDEYVWPNDFIGGSYAAEIGYLKRWLADRTAWLDAHMAEVVRLANGVAPPSGGVSVALAGPNPFSDRARVTLRVRFDQSVRVELVDVLGRVVSIAYTGPARGNHSVPVTIDGSGLAAGVYLVRVTAAVGMRTVPIVKVR